MKRSIFAATLALTPALLHAQATSPAPTASSPVFQARMAPVADIKAAAKAAPAAGNSASVRVSTGIVAPKLLNPVVLSADPAVSHVSARQVAVVVTMTVDENGKPEQLAVAESAGDGLDKQVLAAISKARFQPGTLDGQPFALPVRLRVVIERGTEY